MKKSIDKYICACGLGFSNYLDFVNHTFADESKKSLHYLAKIVDDTSTEKWVWTE